MGQIYLKIIHYLHSAYIKIIPNKELTRGETAHFISPIPAK